MNVKIWQNHSYSHTLFFFFNLKRILGKKNILKITFKFEKKRRKKHIYIHIYNIYIYIYMHIHTKGQFKQNLGSFCWLLHKIPLHKMGPLILGKFRKNFSSILHKHLFLKLHQRTRPLFCSHFLFLCITLE